MAKTKNTYKKSNFKDVNDSILIITNGEQSEKNYFELIKGKYKSPYNIQIKYINGKPSKLFEEAIKLINKFNFIWCVFDVDNFVEDIKIITKKIGEYKNKIRIACSNVSFEIWLLNHFECFEIKATQKECEKYL